MKLGCRGQTWTLIRNKDAGVRLGYLGRIRMPGSDLDTDMPGSDLVTEVE